MDGESPEVLSIFSFKLKPVGIGANRNTLVENDSLSSYSLPEETRQKPEEKQAHGAMRDGKEEGHSHNTTGQVSIDIDNIHEIKHDTSLVEAFMKFMYWSCVSPFNPSKNVDAGENSMYLWALSIIQKTCFAITSSLSLLQAFFWVKYYVLLNFADGGLENFIKMAFFIMSSCTQLYYVYQFVSLQPKLSKMLTSLRNLHQFRRQNSSDSDCRQLFSSLGYATILGSSSLIVSLIEPIWLVETKEWTLEKSLLYHSSETAQGLFLWRSDEIYNSTWNKNMYEAFEKDLSITNATLGVVGIIIYFCTSAQMEAINNVMLMNAHTLKKEVKIMENKLNMEENDETNVTLEGFLRENGEWAHIRMIMHAVKANNDAFDPLMRYKHIDNLTLFVYFIMNVFDGEFTVVYTACLVYVIIKTSCMYRIATEASSLNENATRWICRLGWKSKDKAFLEKVPIMLTELKKNAIGMGKGQFMITESFLYRFLGSVGSVFVLQAQSRETTVT